MKDFAKRVQSDLHKLQQTVQTDFTKLQSTIEKTIQKDFKVLQKTIEKEGNLLLTKIKQSANKAAANPNVQKTRKELERMVESNWKKFEPAVNQFFAGVRKNAGKYGIDISEFETRVKKVVNDAKAGIKKASNQLQKRAGKKTTSKTATSKKTTKRVAPAGKKTTAKKSKSKASSANA